MFKKNNIERKVKEYLELATVQPEPKRFFTLRRELAARGLDIHHPRRLMEEARILDHKASVGQYIKAAEEYELLGKNDPCRLLGRRAEKLEDQRRTLRDAGIENLDPRVLKRIKRNIRERAKLAERQRNPRHQRTEGRRTPVPVKVNLADELANDLSV